MAKKILFVDDEPELAEVVKIRLENSGYEVMTVVTGEEAVASLKEAKSLPDLILLDLLLPCMQGQEVCKWLKSDDRLKNIPVILFTASASDMSRTARECGAESYIMKPFEPEELLITIKWLIDVSVDRKSSDTVA